MQKLAKSLDLPPSRYLVRPRRNRYNQT
uniref:Uncharacterized protein n=1 Tax=Rhizophora mucronata TaxID=61149 RepID=A0A2P2QNI7_RHIMU